MVFILASLFSILFLYVFHKIPTPLLTDIPNERSMHSNPTKRSAGIFFIFIFWMGLIFELYLERISQKDFFFFLIPTFFLGILGFIDDLKNLSSKLKLALELIFIYTFLEFFPSPFSLFGFELSMFSIISNILLTIYIVFILNLVNFMDGLDLYLSLTLIFFTFNLFSFSQYEISPQLNLYFLLIFSMAGFFIYNFPNASMFMGDSGSLPIGFMIAVSPLYLKQDADFLPDISMILYLIPIFLLDGVYTLFKRGLEKKNIFSAHREHFYQRVQLNLGWGKMKTLFIFSSLNLLPSLILPLSSFKDISLFFTLLLLYGILISIEFKIKMKSKAGEI